MALAGALGAGIVVVMILQAPGDRAPRDHLRLTLCLFCILLALPMSGAETIDLPGFGHGALVAAAAIVGVSQLVMTHAYRSLPVSRGSSIQMLLPLVTAAGAWFLFDERFTTPEFAGAALTLLATWRVAASR